MHVTNQARKALRQRQNLGWTLPLVDALGPDSRQLSFLWVQNSLHKLLPFVTKEDRAGLLQALDVESHYPGSPTKDTVWKKSFEISQPDSNRARVAACHLHRTWWLCRFQNDNEFAFEQEAALRSMLEATSMPEELLKDVLEEYESVAAQHGCHDERFLAPFQQARRNHDRGLLLLEELVDVFACEFAQSQAGTERFAPQVSALIPRQAIGEFTHWVQNALEPEFRYPAGHLGGRILTEVEMRLESERLTGRVRAWAVVLGSLLEKSGS
jgi:hypothetical protein